VVPLEFGYQGLPRDPETGLIYFRNRYYDPELGRFISADPKGYTDGPSMYAFEMDDPPNGSDPMGTCKPGEISLSCVWEAGKEAISEDLANAKRAAEFGFREASRYAQDFNALPVTLPQALGKIPGTVRDAAVGVSQTMWGGVDCLSMPSQCWHDVKASLKEVPGQVSQAKEDWENTPWEKHADAWGSGLLTGTLVMAPGAQEFEGATALARTGPVTKTGESADGGRFSGRYADGQKAYRTNVPRDSKNNPIPDPEAQGAHSRLQRDAKDPRRVYSGTEFDASGQAKKRVDHAGRPGQPLPHEHDYNAKNQRFEPKKPVPPETPDKD